MMEKLFIILMIAITCAYVGYGIAGRADGAWVGLMLGPPGLWSALRQQMMTSDV